MFRQSNDVIYIQENTDTFECPVDEFLIYESSYESSTPNNRYWDNNVQYVTDGQSQTADGFYTAEKLSLYESKVGEYQAAYDVMHPEEDEEETIEYTQLYANIELSGGDGKTPLGIIISDPTKNSLMINGDIRAIEDIPASVITQITDFSWRITLCQVRSEVNPSVINSYPIEVSFTDGILNQFEYTHTVPGIYMISEDDFTIVDGSLFGMPDQYKIKLIDHPVFFKILK